MSYLLIQHVLKNISVLCLTERQAGLMQVPGDLGPCKIGFLGHNRHSKENEQCADPQSVEGGRGRSPSERSLPRVRHLRRDPLQLEGQVRRFDSWRFRTFNVLDDINRETLAIEVDLHLTTIRVILVLERVARQRGYPNKLRCDTAPS